MGQLLVIGQVVPETRIVQVHAHQWLRCAGRGSRRKETLSHVTFDVSSHDRALPLRRTITTQAG